MSITNTTRLAGANIFIVDVASDGADTSSGNLAHGLGAAPLEVILTNLTADAATVGAWAATTIDATNVVVTRAAGGAAASTVRVICRRPHTIVR